MEDSELRLEVYAAVVASIAAGRSRFEAQDEHGLDEDELDDLESAVEARLSRALDAEGDGVDPFLQRYDAAMRTAQLRARPAPTASVEELARAIVALERGGEPRAVLERAGLSGADLAGVVSSLGADVGRSTALVEALEAHRAGKRR